MGFLRPPRLSFSFGTKGCALGLALYITSGSLILPLTYLRQSQQLPVLALHLCLKCDWNERHPCTFHPHIPWCRESEQIAYFGGYPLQCLVQPAMEQRQPWQSAPIQNLNVVMKMMFSLPASMAPATVRSPSRQMGCCGRCPIPLLDFA